MGGTSFRPPRTSPCGRPAPPSTRSWEPTPRLGTRSFGIIITINNDNNDNNDNNNDDDNDNDNDNQELRAAFKRRALAAHPDKAGGSKEAFQQVMIAFETLSDDYRRKLYDRRLAVRGAAGAAGTADGKAGGAGRAREPRRRPQASGGPPCGGGGPAQGRSGASPKKAGAAEGAGVPAPGPGPPRGESCSEPEGNRRLESRLRRLFQLLQRLPKERRRQVLEREFEQWQRSALEAWAQRRGGAPEAREAGAGGPAEGDDSEGEQLDGLSDDSSESGSAGSCHLALCDGQASSESQSDAESEAGAARRRQRADADKAGPSVDRRSKAGREQRSDLRGILVRKRAQGDSIYSARTNIGFTSLLTRFVSDLGTALDTLVVLTDIKQRVVQPQYRPGMLAKQDCRQAWLEVERFESVLAAAFAEHGTTPQALGLTIVFRMPHALWIGRLKTLNTPVFHSTEAALSALRRLNPFSSKRRKISVILREEGLGALQRRWEDYLQYNQYDSYDYC